MSTLKFLNLNKIYPNNVQAVFDFNLEVKDKEFIVFVGPSGCGKSTTLRMIAGLEDITSGELYIDDKLINYVVPRNRNIAMVFQSYALYPHMSVYKNMAFGLKIRKHSQPVFEPSEEADAIEHEINTLVRKVLKIYKKFKKQNENTDLENQINELNKQIEDKFEELNKIRKPVEGIDQFSIKEINSRINEVIREINSLQKKLDKQNSLDDKNEKFIEVLNRDLEIKKTELEHKNKELEFYKTNNVPLRKIRHLKKAEIHVNVSKTATKLGLTKYLVRKPAALSGGQRQRVALARAIIRSPKVFLMDEPLSNLDAKLRSQTRNEIAKIHKAVEATTIYVTHDQTEAMTLADRIVIMKDGYIQQIAAPKEAYSKPANMFVAGFIGSPAMNFINGKINKGFFEIDTDNPFKYKLTSEQITMLKEYEGKEIVLGIRPEDIHLSDEKSNENSSNEFKLLVDSHELLGHELLLYSIISNKNVLIKTNVDRDIEIGKEYSFVFDCKKVHFFDKDSTLRIN